MRICARGRGGIVALALVALLAVSCGGGAGAPPGADVDRPPDPSIDLVTFTDVATEVGVDFGHGAYQWDVGGDVASMMGGGVCWIDYDNDGWLDLFAVNTWSDGEWGRWREAGGLPTSRLFRNNHGHFDDVTEQTQAGLEVRGNGCVAADFDGDGRTDLYVTSDRFNALLWNEDGDRFVDGSTEAGVDVSGWQSGAAAGDLNGDGLLDLYVAGYADPNQPITGATKGFPNTFEPEPDLVLLNQGSGPAGARTHFVDVAASVGIEVEQLDYGLGAVMSDVDADGDLDVFVANDTNPNRLYLNTAADTEQGFRFDEVGATAGVDDANAGMGVAAGDYDGDQLPDWAVTNLGQQLHNVFRSEAPGPVYVDALAEIGLPDLGSGLTGWGTNWLDADLDGDLDLLIVHGAIPVTDLDADRQPVRLYENRGAQGFVDSSLTVGLDAVGPYLGRGSAAADYDNDGD
ncbi:MAG: FG-GAP repeat domain-containing protein, partial [Acidimicrobiales bacterium]